MSECTQCSLVGKVHVHHKDGNHENDVPENRVVLCPSCHRRRHIDMLIESTGRPSTEALAERVYAGPTAKCLRCAHEWRNQVAQPLLCPKCHSPCWDMVKAPAYV